MISPPIKKKIQDIVSVFETSSLKPRYDILVVQPDGPNKQLQITYGKHQTTEFGNLKALLTMYCASHGRYAQEFRPYMYALGKQPLSSNNSFKYLLKMAGTDITMHEVQDAFFDEYYWNPALNFFLRNNFKLPLSMAVIYDSYIHSGGVPAWLRDDFREVPPAKGGDEKQWVNAYVNTRDYWLEHHPDKLLRNTDYRTDTFIDCIAKNNWDLSLPVVCKFNSNHKTDWITI